MEPDFFQRYNKHIIFSIVFLSVGISIWGFLYPNSPILKLLPFFYATISLLVTLKAFDQFGVRKVIAERRVKAVLELSDEIEKNMITIRCRMGHQKFKTAHCYISSSQQATKQEYFEFLDTQVYLEIGDQAYFDKLFYKFQKNKFLPDEIKPTLNFTSQFKLFFESERHITGDYSIVYLYCVKPENTFLVSCESIYTLENLLDDFGQVLKSCETWINKHTQILN